MQLLGTLCQTKTTFLCQRPVAEHCSNDPSDQSLLVAAQSLLAMQAAMDVRRTWHIAAHVLSCSNSDKDTVVMPVSSKTYCTDNIHGYNVLQHVIVASRCVCHTFCCTFCWPCYNVLRKHLDIFNVSSARG